MLFGSGYMANIGVLAALLTRHDRVLQDRLNHVSLLEGARLSHAKMHRYPHTDSHAMAELLATPHAGLTLLATDGVFSMEGDLAPLEALSQVCQDRSDCLLYVDDAHGFGVLGAEGAGVVSHCQLTAQQVPLYMGTFSKALGSYGAFVAGSADMISYLQQFARSYGYTTALPPVIASCILDNLDRMQQSDLRPRLQQVIRYFRQQAADAGLQLLPSMTPIQPVLVGDLTHTVQVSEQLFREGLWVTAMRPPSVTTPRLRVTLQAQHTPQQIDRLIDRLAGYSRL